MTYFYAERDFFSENGFHPEGEEDIDYREVEEGYENYEDLNEE